jgi:thermitase
MKVFQFLKKPINYKLKLITLFHERSKAMKAKILKLGLLIFLMPFLFWSGIPAHADSKSGTVEATEFAPGVVIVKFAEGVTVKMEKKEGYVTTGIPSIDALNKKHGVRELVKIFSPEPRSEKGKNAYRELGLGRVYSFVATPEANVQAMVSEYEADPNVEYAEPDYVGHAHFIPNDPNFWRQWGLYNTGLNPPEHPGTVDADVDATEAWPWWAPEHVIVLAILDTGVDIDHPDLSGVIWQNTPECSGIGGIDDDGNGYVDDCNGYDFANGDGNPQDDHGHGTVNAGIAGAHTNNNVGVAGMVGGSFNPHRIMAVKVLDSNNFGYYSWWEAGLYYAANNNASVINMSMGGTSFSSTLQTAVNYAWGQGCVVVASMGNANSSTPQYPAAFTNAIAVGATDTDDSRCVPPDWQTFGMPTGGSNYGSHIDVVAPGNWIYSTVWNNTYGYWAGTSMAAPYVSGLAAMIMCEQWPEPSPDVVRQIIQSTADDTVGLPGEDTPGWDQYYGWGRINAKRALGVPTPIYAEDFNDCDISDWTVYTSSGTFATTSAQYVSPPCGLYMSSMASGYAYGRTPDLDIDTTQDFTITTYFRLPQTNNHWFWVLSNRWVEIVIDNNDDLCAYQPPNPTIKLADLNTNQWYHIKAVVHPATSNYDIYLNCYYVATANFSGTYLRYLRLGEFENGGSNFGEGYWDDLLVYGQKSCPHGDTNGDGVINSADVVYLINYLFKGGPAPDPLCAGDVNCDDVINSADVVYLINYLFKGGPAPCEGKASMSSGGESELYKGKVPAQIGLSLSAISKNGILEVPVIGKFDVDIAAVELEVKYDPEEITLLEPALTPRTEGLQIYSSVKDGIQKIGILDISGEHYISAGTGALVNLRIRGSDLSSRLASPASGEASLTTSLEITKAILVDPDAQEIPVRIVSEMKKSEENLQATESAIPQEFFLSQNYPNPFNPETEIKYALPQDCDVKLVIYNILGEKVRVLVDEHQTAGFKTVRWAGRNQNGEEVGSGVYFYRLEANELSEAKKMILIK